MNTNQSKDDALRQIGENLRVMLASSTELVDGAGNVAGYQIKTGALHRILGVLSAAGHPVHIPAAMRRSVMLGDSANASVPLLSAMSRVLDLTATEPSQPKGNGFDGDVHYAGGRA